MNIFSFLSSLALLFVLAPNITAMPSNPMDMVRGGEVEIMRQSPNPLALHKRLDTQPCDDWCVCWT